jgi:TetR/AcrR family transcriptional regulator, cholesterol catabolism regulator
LDLRGARLYHYFSSKEELSLRCVHKSAAEVCARLRAIAPAELAPGDKLLALFRAQALIEVRENWQYLQ